MRIRLIFAAAIAAVPASPAFASAMVAPGPEAGAGLFALAALGAGYTWMRARKARK